MDKENIKVFSEGFFRNLKADVSWQDEVLSVKNVPKDFEEYFGKNSPYFLTFDKDTKIENAELMVKGGFLLKAMTTYLGNRGQTSIIKINFDFPETEIKDFLKLKNASIYRIDKKIDYHFFLRFTFLSNFQYLNEREQIMSHVYIKEGEVVNFNLEDYPTLEGKKEEVRLHDIKPDYQIAREKLKTLLEKRIDELSKILDKKLEKETERIKQHYLNQINEYENHTKKISEQIKDLEKSSDSKSAEIKINRLKEQLETISNSGGIEKLKKEEDFFINDEIHKHSLNLDNKLINTTIIYYPIYNLSPYIKNKDSARQIELIFNPLTKNLSSISCEQCKKITNELMLCATGHIVCEKCSKKCGECGKDYCASCLDRECTLCGKKLCRKCSFKCLGCGKYRCKSHMKKDSITGKELCTNCIKSCPICGNFTERIRKCPTCDRELICEKCLSTNGPENVKCKLCFQECTTCKKSFPKSQSAKCSGFNCSDCGFISKCPSCRKQLCFRLKR